jgi:hypothetical protein
VKPRTKLTPQREKLQILRRTTHSLRKERATTSVATKNSGKKGMTRTRTTRRGPKGPYNPHRRMREPHQPQQVKTKTGPRHTTGTYLPLGSAPINLETTIQSQHPIATTIDPILLITPPDASDVRKQKNYPFKLTLSIGPRA